MQRKARVLPRIRIKRSGPISRVLSWTIIYLVCTSPRSSSHATRARAGPTHGAPICACSGRGLPSRRVATTLVVFYTTVSAFLSPARMRAAGVFFSAALSVGLPRLAVNQLPALWSPDFPHARRLPAKAARSSGPLRCAVLYHAVPARHTPLRRPHIPRARPVRIPVQARRPRARPLAAPHPCRTLTLRPCPVQY